MANLKKLAPTPPGCLPNGVTDQHGKDAFEVRFRTATHEATKTGSVKHTTNGDEARYSDKSGTYTKCLLQTAVPGVVDPVAFGLFRKALGSSDGVTPGTADFEIKGLLGAGRKLNGPLGAFALTLVGADSQQFGDAIVPHPPQLASKEYATELIELYWASLLRDVPFTEYATNDTAIAAANELTDKQSFYAGPTDQGKVIPQLLFRGGLKDGKKTYFAGEEFGPYISQFCIRPTNLGVQPIDQKMETLAPDVDYLTELDAWHAVQNGVFPLAPPKQGDQNRYMHNGRALCAFTHKDELYQAYLTAYLVLNTLFPPGAGLPPPAGLPNPQSPYAPPKGFENQQAFGTFGGPDVVATLGAVARAALNAVWYQKWIVHLRHRPESGGGIVHLMNTGRKGTIDGHVDQLVLGSMAVQQSLVKNGSYLLSQAFPEGSPAHPAYPTGHGSVAGACITVLKFFYADAPMPNPMVPSSDGLSLEPYTGSDAAKMTVNGELHKLAHNISFGHGIHAGIHWRSDTDYSLLLGEAVALSFLQDQAYTYKEKFSVTLKKMDGTPFPIAN